MIDMIVKDGHRRHCICPDVTSCYKSHRVLCDPFRSRSEHPSQEILISLERHLKGRSDEIFLSINVMPQEKKRTHPKARGHMHGCSHLLIQIKNVFFALEVRTIYEKNICTIRRPKWYTRRPASSESVHTGGG